LLPGGGPATFANYISYDQGINGIMIDISGLADPGGISAADFQFVNTGRDGPGVYAIQGYTDTLAVAPSGVEVVLGGGENGSDRIVITWDNEGGATANAPWPNNKNAWLEVTVLATGQTGLAAPDVHYWGLAVGEGGPNTGNGAIWFAVAAGDIVNTRQQQPGNPLTDPVSITHIYDYNRDGIILGASDGDLAQSNQTSPIITALRAISP
jgi:hypothetical protein